MGEAIPTNNKKFWLFWIISIVIGVVMILVIWLPNRHYYCSDALECVNVLPFGLVSLFLVVAIVFRIIQILKQRSIYSFKKIVTPLILFSFLYPIISTFSSSADVNNLLETEAITIQKTCIENNKCPSAIDGKQFKRVRAGSYYTSKDSSDEIAISYFNKDGVGYNEKGITYKLKPWHGFIVINYKSTNNKFKLSYTSDSDDLGTVEISGGVGSELIFKESCSACGGIKDTIRTLQ
jgi:hypothetical protein